MNIFDTTDIKKTKGIINVEHPISAMVLYTDVDIDDMTTEMISMKIQRTGLDDIPITGGQIPLKELILVNTLGQDALGCNLRLNFPTEAHIELVNTGGLYLLENQSLLIELTGLKSTSTYILDGIEDPHMSKGTLTYERKIIASEKTIATVDVMHYDRCIFNDTSDIYEIDFQFDDGRTTTHTPRELKSLMTSQDPIAQIRLDGTVRQCFDGYLQLPCKGIKNIVFRKKGNVQVNVLMMHDIPLKQSLRQVKKYPQILVDNPHLKQYIK